MNTRCKSSSESEDRREISNIGNNSLTEENSESHIFCCTCLNQFSNVIAKLDDVTFNALKTNKYVGLTWKCQTCETSKQ